VFVYNIYMIYELQYIVAKAGEMIMEVYNTDFEVDYKEDKSPVTIADKRASDFICAEISKLSKYPIVCEETFSQVEKYKTYWLVDPLDGTKEFIRKGTDFTVNVALIKNGKTISGFVYVPMTKELYYSYSNAGAYKLQFDVITKEAIINCKNITQLHVRDVPEQITVMTSKSHMNQETLDYISNYNVKDTFACGSSLKFLMIAEGKADLYPRLGLTSEWDTAAAHSIVKEAGGQVVDLQGRELRYNKNNILNPFFIVCNKYFLL